jgi:drug/metabolite transporter (DMT)-like permease
LHKHTWAVRRAISAARSVRNAALPYAGRNVIADRSPGSRDVARDHTRALLLVALCGVLWSTAGFLIKLVDWNSAAIWSVRSAIAAVGLWAWRRPSFARISAAEWRAAFAVAATTGLFILANKLTTAANAILIQYSAPIWVALLGAWLLGERATRLDWLTIVAVLGGIALFFVEQLTFDHIAGNLVALGAGIAFAVNVTSFRQVALTPGAASDPLRAMLLGNMIAAVLGAPFALASSSPGLTGWGALAALGLFQQAAAYVCYAWAIRHATALEATLVAVIEPILSPIWVAIATGERPGPWAVIGGAIVIGAVTARAVIAGSRTPRTPRTLRPTR